MAWITNPFSSPKADPPAEFQPRVFTDTDGKLQYEFEPGKTIEISSVVGGLTAFQIVPLLGDQAKTELASDAGVALLNQHVPGLAGTFASKVVPPSPSASHVPPSQALKSPPAPKRPRIAPLIKFLASAQESLDEFNATNKQAYKNDQRKLIETETLFRGTRQIRRGSPQ